MTSWPATNKSKPLVFYDGGCSLCSKEIEHYKRLDSDFGISWIDINRDQALLNALGVSGNQAMRQLHVLDGNGVLRTGVYAFLAIWAELPYYRTLAKVVRTARLAPIIERGYQRFATWRYDRRSSQTCSMTVGQ